MKTKEKNYDNYLNIKTTKIIETDSKLGHNRCEPTPYHVLDKIFLKYNLKETDNIVDFGCGLGRVSFYIHNKFKCNVTGVEAYDNIFNDLLRNKRNYKIMHNNIDSTLKFEFGLAELFDILPEHNKFYFFNPFSVHIFKKIVYNILNSYKKNPREIDIILYYPLPDFLRFLKKDTNFNLIHKKHLRNPFDRFDKIKIFRLD